MINKNIFEAVETGNVDELKKALTVNHLNALSYYGARSMVLAVESGNVDIIEMLLKSTKNTNRESFWSRSAWSALSSAVYAENIEITKLLLEYGAGTDKRILNGPFLAYAIFKQNEAMESLLKKYGFGINKKGMDIFDKTDRNIGKTKFSYEDGVYIPQKLSRDSRFIQSVKEGTLKKINDLLEESVSEKALLVALDAALEKDNWEIASIILDHSKDRDVEVYTECLKKMFLKASYIGNTEKVKVYLEKLIENAVGVLSDETGKSTLEIALENNPTDIIKILSNYGFHDNSLQLAYKSLLYIEK